MADLFTRYARFQSARESLSALPKWAGFILVVFALPGIALAVLALLIFIVSILALLLLTVPAYRVLRAVAGLSPARGSGGETSSTGTPEGIRRVEARVVDPT